MQEGSWITVSIHRKPPNVLILDEGQCSAVGRPGWRSLPLIAWVEPFGWATSIRGHLVKVVLPQSIRSERDLSTVRAPNGAVVHPAKGYSSLGASAEVSRLEKGRSRQARPWGASTDRRARARGFPSREAPLDRKERPKGASSRIYQVAGRAVSGACASFQNDFRIPPSRVREPRCVHRRTTRHRPARS